MTITTVKVNRMQYGVGQGGFHAQQIRRHNLPDGISAEAYRFVYDCGSDTGPLKSKATKPLNWAIEHFAGNSDRNQTEKICVNSLYLSHFQKDHIDGARRLAELVDLQEVVIPHLAKDQFVHLLIQQIASGEITELTEQTREYVNTLARAASDEALFENIPTTRVMRDDSASDKQSPAGNPNQTDKGRDPLITHDLATVGTWAHDQSRILTAHPEHNNNPDPQEFWELRVWSYAQANAVTAAVKAELEKLTALPKILEGLADLNELAWAIKNRTLIQEAYKKALKTAGTPYSADHNVVSLCLHSGPLDDTKLTRNGNCQLIPCLWIEKWLHTDGSSDGSWIGTGDALLRDQGIWDTFKAHFSRDNRDRPKNWRTILMPHHGSVHNFNDALISGNVCHAVFSVGAFNKYKHPSMSVLEAVADAGVTCNVVTEFTRPGFFEHLTYELPPPSNTKSTHKSAGQADDHEATP